MPVSIYLKSDDIQGAITTKGFEKTFELLSFSFGHVRNVGSRVGNTGKVDSSLANIQELVFTKHHDVASTKLFEYSFSGKLLSKLVISLVRQDATGPIT